MIRSRSPPLTYALKTTVGDAFEKLAPLGRVHGEDHDEVTHDASGAVASASLNWVKAGNRQHKDWNNTVLGTLRLEADRLVAEVNSTRRAEELKREIAKCLGRTAVLTDTAVIDPSEGLHAPAGQRAQDELRDEARPEPSPELRAIEEELSRRHWEAWLDARVPALGNKTPRQAARTASGRERLEAPLAEFDRSAMDGPSSEAGHIATIRAALRLTEPLT